jgi:RluA family pseudouridine synthase
MFTPRRKGRSRGRPGAVIPTLYEDDGLLAVHKPAGLVVIPARDEDPSGALRQRLEAARGEALWVVHRIDRDTSGVVLFARSADAHRALNGLFASRAVDKVYVAFTRGAPSPPRGVIEVPLHTARKGKMRPALPGEADALDARTDYAVLATWERPDGVLAKIEARPHTGRQHQVRVHLRSVGAPLLMDPLYGRTAEGLAPSRMALHAAAVTLPWRGRALTVEAPLATDLSDFERALRGG